MQWCREMLELSPIALRLLKARFNADFDGQAGIQELAGNATLLYYLTEEAQEGTQRVRREAEARLQEVPAAAVIAAAPTAVAVAPDLAARRAAEDADRRGRAGAGGHGGSRWARAMSVLLAGAGRAARARC